MSVSAANWCRVLPLQAIKHHTVLVAWSPEANANESDQYVAVLRMDFCFDSSTKWEKDFGFNQWSQWSSERFKSQQKTNEKRHWHAQKFNSCHLMSYLINRFRKPRENTSFGMQCGPWYRIYTTATLFVALVVQSLNLSWYFLLSLFCTISSKFCLSFIDRMTTPLFILQLKLFLCLKS